MPKSKGKGGFSAYRLASIFWMYPSFPLHLSAIVVASVSVGIGFFSCWASRVSWLIWILALICQYAVGVKFVMVFSFVVRNLSVGPCTLPVLSVRYFWVCFLYAVVRALVRFIP